MTSKNDDIENHAEEELWVHKEGIYLLIWELALRSGGKILSHARFQILSHARFHFCRGLAPSENKD